VGIFFKGLRKGRKPGSFDEENQTVVKVEEVKRLFLDTHLSEFIQFFPYLINI
jgi:hypothetical protein